MILVAWFLDKNVVKMKNIDQRGGTVTPQKMKRAPKLEKIET